MDVLSFRLITIKIAFVFTLIKQRRIYFSNCFLDSSPTNAVTGMAASFYKIKDFFMNSNKEKMNIMFAMRVLYTIGSKME